MYFYELFRPSGDPSPSLRPLPPLLGVGLLHHGAPELVAVVRVAVHQLVVHRGQAVVDHHVHPLPEAPEAEVEDARVGLGPLRVPLLLLPVRDDLVGVGVEEEEEEER